LHVTGLPEDALSCGALPVLLAELLPEVALPVAAPEVELPGAALLPAEEPVADEADLSTPP
jgi:hypothetical protein